MRKKLLKFALLSILFFAMNSSKFSVCYAASANNMVETDHIGSSASVETFDSYSGTGWTCSSGTWSSTVTSTGCGIGLTNLGSYYVEKPSNLVIASGDKWPTFVSGNGFAVNTRGNGVVNTATYSITPQTTGKVYFSSDIVEYNQNNAQDGGAIKFLDSEGNAVFQVNIPGNNGAVTVVGGGATILTTKGIPTRTAAALNGGYSSGLNIDVVIDLDNLTIQGKIIYCGTSDSKILTQSFSGTLSSGASVAQLVVSSTSARSSCNNTIILDNTKFYSEVDPSVTQADYTVNYVDENSTVIKSLTFNGTVGQSISIDTKLKKPFYNSDKSIGYYYVSDDSSSKNIKADNSTVVTIVCNSKQIMNYTYTTETLSRGSVAVPADNGTLISWRRLDNDNNSTVFDVYRNGTLIAKDLRRTNYLDDVKSAGDVYKVVAKVNGSEVGSETTTSWSNIYKTLTLPRPTGGSDYTYSPCDCSAGDVDGDGDYEIIVKWDPSNSQDNSVNGITGNVFLDCYKLNGTQLWRIDLGMNIRAGAHYTQFLVYDFDGNGKAELICKTAPGSKDGTGVYVNQASIDNTIKNASNTTSWVNTNGRINGGHEYLTVFNGKTGKAIHTIAYNPNRNAESALSTAEGTFNWDDRSGKSDYGSYGNRGERYLAAVASLGGPNANPSAILCRGYYTYAYVWAVDFNGTQLIPHWLHRSDSKTSYSVVNYQTNTSGQSTQYIPTSPTSGSGSSTLYGNGNHNLSIGDVDGDGKDEIIYGSGALDDNGTLLYATGFGHGDAIHLTDIDPDCPGLEVFDVHEEGNRGWDLHSALTGQILNSATSTDDNGRGMAADIYESSYGLEFWSARGGSILSADGTELSTKRPSMNFRTYWDGDLQDNLLDGTAITDWNGTSGVTILEMANYGSSASCNGTKATPCLSADLFGDWREEIVLRGASTSTTYDINIFSTSIPTPYLVTTPMQDHVYRMGIAWQNVAYNQPPHLGYYLPDVASVKVTFDSQGYTSFSSNKNVTMAGMDGVTAYKGTLDGSTIKLYKVTEIPAGQGAILHGEGMANKTVYLPVIYDADEIANNAFVGAPDGATVAEKSAYVLSYTSSKGEAFYVYGGTSIPAGKAYLPIPAGGAKVLYFAFEDETGVMEVPVADGFLNDGFYYSITGVRVENPTKGIYIKNGKKVYIK